MPIVYSVLFLWGWGRKWGFRCWEGNIFVWLIDDNRGVNEG